MPVLFILHPCLLYTCTVFCARANCSIIHAPESQWRKWCDFPRRRHRLEHEPTDGCSPGSTGEAQDEISQEKQLACGEVLCCRWEIKKNGLGKSKGALGWFSRESLGVGGRSLVAGGLWHSEERDESWVPATSAEWRQWVRNVLAAVVCWVDLSKDTEEKVFQGLSHTPVMVPACVWLQRGISRDFGCLCRPWEGSRGKRQRSGSRWCATL